MCRNETLFLQDGCFAWGIKRICLANQFRIFRCFYDTYTVCASSLAHNTSEDILEPLSQHSSLFSSCYPPSPVSPYSLPAVSLTASTLPFESLFSQFISNWHFMKFNLQRGTMGTFHHTEWYEKPQTLWMGSERQNKINKWVSQSDPEYWWQDPQWWVTLHFSSFSFFYESLSSPFVLFIVSQGTCCLLTRMC